MGQSPESCFYNTEGRGMPFLQGSKTFGRIFPTFSSFTERTTKTALKGDVLMSVRAPVGDINIAPTDMCIGRGLCSIRMKNGNQKYLFYLLKNNIRNILSKQNGTVFASVNRKDLESLELYVLNEEEQKSFGDFLALFDEKINLNDVINDNLSKQISTLIAHAFPYSADELMSGWHKVKLTEVASLTNGYSYKGDDLKSNGNTALVTIKNFDRYGGFKLDGFKELIPSARVKPEQYANIFDLLVAHTDLTQNAEVIGNAEVVLSKGKYDKLVFSMDLVCIRPIGNFGKFVLAALLHDKRFKEHCLGYVNGTTVLHLSKTALEEYCFLAPDDASILCKLDLVLSTLYRKQAEIIEENIRLSETRDLLMKKLLSGETEPLEFSER